MNGSEGISSRQSGVPLTLPLGEVAVLVFGLAAFLPYVKTSPLGSDVQPHYYAIVPFVFLLFLRFNAAKTLHCIYCIFLLGFGAYLKMSPIELIAFAGVCLTTTLVAGLDQRQREILSWAVRVALVLYLVVAFLELVGASGVLDQVVSNRRRSASRGLCSLASEPSFLGFVGLAGFVVLRKHASPKFPILDAVLPFLVIICSGSVAAILPAAFVAVAGSLKSIQAVVVSVISLLVLPAVAFALFPNSRFVELTKQSMTSPAEVLEVSSGANRIFRGVGPSYYGVKTALMPHSPHELDQIYRKMKFLRDDVRITRISNLGGMLIFVFGVFSLPLVIGYSLHFRESRIDEITFAVAVVGAFSFSLITASTPYFHVVLGCLLWRNLPATPSLEGPAISSQSNSFGELA